MVVSSESCSCIVRLVARFLADWIVDVDSKSGKIMEKLGGLMGNEKMQQKGYEKREQAGYGSGGNSNDY